MRILIGWLMLVLAAAAQAQERPPVAPSAAPADVSALSPAEAQRLKGLSAELRCLVCQNQSLADSNADLAVDLRNQVRDQIRAGQSDDQIKEYLVQRYGEFVLYRPRVTAVTGLLWVGPFLLLVLGGAAMWRYVRRRQRAQSVDAGSTDGAEAQARLERARALLRGDSAGDRSDAESAQ